MTFTDEQIKQIGYGYDLDCGGYEFERVEGNDDVLHEDGDKLGEYTGRYGDGSFLRFAPFRFGEHANALFDADGTVSVKIASGVLDTTEHECHCHGKLVEWTGAAGEPTEPLGEVFLKCCKDNGFVVPTGPLTFEHTGDSSDLPYPNCPRCEGYGHLESAGGSWALYEYQDAEEYFECLVENMGETITLSREQMKAFLVYAQEG